MENCKDLLDKLESEIIDLLSCAEDDAIDSAYASADWNGYSFTEEDENDLREWLNRRHETIMGLLSELRKAMNHGN